MQVEPDKTVLL